MNTIKTVLLMSVLTILLVFVGNILGGSGGMMIAFLFAVVMNFGTYWFSDKIVLRMYKAQQLQREDNPELFRMTEELTARAGIPMPKLYIIPNDQPNAFATGRNPQNAAVAVTNGILKLLSREELMGVIAHELSHVKNRDILVGTIAATIAGAISMLANMAQWAMIFGGRGSSDERGGNPITLIVMMIVAPLAAMMIQMAISRSREFMADEGGAKMTGNPLYLANALRKLDTTSKRIPMEANSATAHMFIVSPLRGGGFTKLFSTHPPMEERVAKLEAMVYGSIS
ncbi:MAG: zinc metalloprotease HtpX [Bacteroidota bacterium]|nr:zinc metalloprotease HtpX [Bacteroidota bacterium]